MKLDILGDEERVKAWIDGIHNYEDALEPVCEAQAKATAKQIVELIKSPAALTKIVTELEEAIK